MSKERLEEISKGITSLNSKSGMPKEVLTHRGWESVVPVFTKDIEYLMERVQELEEGKVLLGKQVLSYSQYWDKAKEQNKRYREALEKVYVNQTEVPTKHGKTSEVARQALESESE